MKTTLFLKDCTLHRFCSPYDFDLKKNLTLCVTVRLPLKAKIVVGQCPFTSDDLAGALLSKRKRDTVQGARAGHPSRHASLTFGRSVIKP
ncbi:hypothetical protein BaRGS_00018543 [Batillaria attramentaria]|uniref:Uncharacterized protein n=1 Tax=Batillaria attramentaria TaxID=370345 RepID=A0ABD0KT88_9CAEN